jgi:hypothetical protein
MRGGIIPGFHSEDHRAAFVAARDRWLAAGGPQRCSASAKHGGPCGAIALRGHKQCRHHVANPVRRARRLLHLTHPVTAKQAARALVREQARLVRVGWKTDRWTDGATVDLGPRENTFQADMRSFGFSPSCWSPATLDAARWCWVGVQAGRMSIDQLRARIRWHVAQDAFTAV